MFKKKKEKKFSCQIFILSVLSPSKAIWKLSVSSVEKWLLLQCTRKYKEQWLKRSVISSVTQSCPTLCDSIDCSMPGLPDCHQFLELTQIHVHWVGDAIQPSHPLLSPSSPALNLFQHQGLFKWVSSLHQVAKVLEFQLQQQSFQWTPRTDLL